MLKVSNKECSKFLLFHPSYLHCERTRIEIRVLPNKRNRGSSKNCYDLEKSKGFIEVNHKSVFEKKIKQNFECKRHSEN